MFCHLVVQVKLSVLAKWLVRKTPLRKPNRGEGIVSRKPRPKNACDFLGLLYCFIVLLCIYVVSCPDVIIFPTFMVQYSLFVLKVPLNPQANKHTLYGSLFTVYIFPSLLLHCWLGDGKGIQPVKISHQQFPKVLSWETFDFRPNLEWSRGKMGRWYKNRRYQ